MEDQVSIQRPEKEHFVHLAKDALLLHRKQLTLNKNKNKKKKKIALDERFVDFMKEIDSRILAGIFLDKKPLA